MTSLASIPVTEKGKSTFYPTPAKLAAEMMSHVDWRYVGTALEPSAGKGDLALIMADRINTNRGKYRATVADAGIDCVEIDPHLRAILKDKGLRVVHDDFLTYNTMKRYSLIAMNPPFDDGVKHLLKAITLLDDGGQLVCLLNAESIRNPFSNERQALVRALKAYDAHIDYVDGGFVEAERKTGVDVALVSFRKPAVEATDGLIMQALRKAHKYASMTEEETATLTKADFIDAIVDRYQYEVECGCKLIDEWRRMNHLLNSSITPDAAYSSLTLGLVVDNKSADPNEYIRRVRKKYWSALFCSHQFVSQLTTNLREQLYKRVEELADYEFSAYNIYELMLQMNAQVIGGVEKTIMSLFDDWTRKYHWDENAQNRHYFDGWRTNDAFAVNKKVIIPLRAYNYWSSTSVDVFRAYNVRDKLLDIEKVFNYLDGGRTPEKDLVDVLNECEKTGNTKKVDSKYFYLTFYKKGTCHIEFKNPDLLAKFNIFAAKGKNWLPPSFGKKRYAEMTEEEQHVAVSFMGNAKTYDAVVAHADFFLTVANDMPLNLTA